MKKSLARILVGLVITAAALMLNPPSKSKPPAVLPETDGCRLKTLNGTYGSAFSGWVLNSGQPPFIPVAAAGAMTFQPDGTITRSFNLSFGGTILLVGDPGTYSADSNGDCGFTANFPQSGELWNLTPVEEGLQIEFFVNAAGKIGAGTLTHQ